MGGKVILSFFFSKFGGIEDVPLVQIERRCIDALRSCVLQRRKQANKRLRRKKIVKCCRKELLKTPNKHRISRPVSLNLAFFCVVCIDR